MCKSGGHRCTPACERGEGRKPWELALVEIIDRVATNGWACYYLYLIVDNAERLASLPPPGKAGFPLLVLPLLFVENLDPSAWFLPP